MPHAAPNEAEAARNPPDQTSPPSGGPQPEPRPAGTAPRPGASGALFRALVDAGADAVAAYTAEEGMESMVSVAVANQVQPILVEMRQLFAVQERRLDVLEQRLDVLERRLDVLERGVAECDRKLDAVAAEDQKTNEVLAVKLDALRRELRLIWGALGISLTVWLAVLGYLLTN